MNRSRLTALFLILLIWGTFLLTTSRSSLWDRDEPRFARATVEMVESGNYLVPTFNTDLRPDKPILIYWLMSVPVRLFGQKEWACRFFAPLGVAATCFLLLWLGGLLFDRKNRWAVFLAVGIMALNPLMLMCGTAATTDAVLLAFISAAIAIFFSGMKSGFDWKHALGLGAAMGLAQLTKGPVGLAIPVLTILAYLWLERSAEQTGRVFWLRFAVAVAVSLLFFIAWGLPANIATGGRLAKLGLGHHVVQRSVSPLEGHGGRFILSLPFYVPVILVGFFPWILFLPAGLSALAGDRFTDGGLRNVLIAWTLPTFVLMTLVATKLPHYVLPIWPALALLTAAVIEKAEAGRLAARDLKWLVRGRRLFVTMGAGSVAAALIAPWVLPLHGLHGAFFALAGLFLAITAGAWREHRLGRYRSSAMVLITGMLLFIMVLDMVVLPGLEPYKPSPTIASAINRRVPRDVPVWLRKYKEPSLIFYLDRKEVYSLHNDEETINWAKRCGPAVLVITGRAYGRIKDRLDRAGLEEICRVRGFNVSKGRRVEVIAFLKGAKTNESQR